MHRRRSLLVSAALVALIGMLAVVSFSDDSAKADDVLLVGSGSFDLALALDEAVSGDEIILNGDTILFRNATIKPGVTLDDNGFSLTIPAVTVLDVKGTLVSSGDLLVESRGSIVVSSGGLMTMDNNKNTAEVVVAGSLEVLSGGIFNFGSNKESILECLGGGKLSVDGVMTVGHGTLNSVANIRNGTVTGELQIYGGSIFRVTDILNIGRAPEYLTESTNNAKITGMITIDNAGCILVYGKANFGPANIKYPAVQTKFAIAGTEYATEYKDKTGKKTLVFPVTTSLKDWRLTDWRDESGNIVTESSNIQIGSTDVLGDAEKISYRLSFAKDENIIWKINGIERGSSWSEYAAYEAKYVITVTPARGHTDVPDIFKDGKPFKRGDTLTVTDDATFTTSNHYLEPAKSKVPMLLVVIGVLTVIVILGLAALIIGNNKSKAK